MRSTFNIVIVDDLFADEDDRGELDNYINNLKQIITNKGFHPEFKEYDSSSTVLTDINDQERKRIDLYISDNNLGDEVEGVDFYLKLRQGFICDFILYTQSGVDNIISKLKQDLEENKDPNLFSRFTFVSRQNNSIWKAKSQEIINHIISKREEFNNLRGLFAQSTSKIHSHLASKALSSNEEKRFSSTIEIAYEKNIIDEDCRKKLHEIRLIRNALMHEDEIKCDVTKKYYIKYKTPRFFRNRVYEDGSIEILYEDSNFTQLRQRIKNLESKILRL
ncbi:hypothetical protein [Acinetobacter sp.]|uniref:hypothetical protein n=1 Tax=Acinetobacter sp. TaxID=472 RepID=UPI002897934F|nr:hypothetical protein [Acinetobacter sp.]